MVSVLIQHFSPLQTLFITLSTRYVQLFVCSTGQIPPVQQYVLDKRLAIIEKK